MWKQPLTRTRRVGLSTQPSTCTLSSPQASGLKPNTFSTHISMCFATRQLSSKILHCLTYLQGGDFLFVEDLCRLSWASCASLKGRFDPYQPSQRQNSIVRPPRIQKRTRLTDCQERPPAYRQEKYCQPEAKRGLWRLVWPWWLCWWIPPKHELFEQDYWHSRVWCLLLNSSLNRLRNPCQQVVRCPPGRTHDEVIRPQRWHWQSAFKSFSFRHRDYKTAFEVPWRQIWPSHDDFLHYWRVRLFNN